MAPVLPLELLFEVVNQVTETRDLKSLALCCAALQDAAQRSIFRAPLPRGNNVQDRFIAAIDASPSRLGPMVHTLAYFCDEEVSHLPNALASMTNLKKLILMGGRQVSPSALQHIAPLEAFAWRRWNWNRRHMLELLREALPKYQPTLRHLELSDPRTVILDAEFPEDPNPHLISLRIGPSLARLFFRDAAPTIRSLEWMGRRSPGSFISSNHLNYLRFLKMEIDDFEDDLTFTQHLISLELLELCVRDYETDVICGMLTFVQGMPSLRVLILQQSTGVNAERYFTEGLSLEDGPSLIISRHVFGLCQTLRYVDCAQVTRWTRAMEFRRFQRPGRDEDINVATVQEAEVFKWRELSLFH